MKARPSATAWCCCAKRCSRPSSRAATTRTGGSVARSMKWFTTTNEASLDNDSFFLLLQVAVLSARQNTSLEPFLVYDGNEHQRLTWLRDQGVVIVNHELPFRQELSDYLYRTCKAELLPELVEIRSGAYLKTEIPTAVREHGVTDRFVLYTDCDVIFMRDLELHRKKPRYLAACGNREGGRTRLRLGGWVHFNSGIMLMNVDAMCSTAAEFRTFVMNNGGNAKRPPSKFMQKNLFLSDQVALNVFHRGRIQSLSPSYNWHPTRGVDHRARIIHFNGLKWTQWNEFQEERLLPERMESFKRLVAKNPAAYEEFVTTARNYLACDESTPLSS